ncbi:MAG: winged helix-turn-helix domain-containing protein [Nitrososphaerota archaeon]|nr:winged helix-turn-helix domain-containing protein [Nitrososphaerota archaeon]
MKKTNLATASGLAYDKLAKYLEWIMEKNFLDIDSEEFVCLTSKGNEAYEELVKSILEHIGRLEFPRF